MVCRVVPTRLMGKVRQRMSVAVVEVVQVRQVQVVKKETEEVKLARL